MLTGAARSRRGQTPVSGQRRLVCVAVSDIILPLHGPLALAFLSLGYGSTHLSQP